MMKSLGAAVRISNGRPPASRTASLTTFAMPSRWLKQIASSDELLTTAIFGFSRSSSVRPSAFHCARRTASRGDPARNYFGAPSSLQRNLSHNMATVTPATDHRSPATEVEPPALLSKAWYWYYVLGAADALLRRERRRPVAGARGVAPGDQARVRRDRRAAGHADRPAVRDVLFVSGHPDRGVGRPVEPPQRARVVVRAVERRDRRSAAWPSTSRCCLARASAPPSAKPAAARRRTRSSPTTFRSSSAARRFRSLRWPCPSARRSARRSAAGARSTSAGARRSISSGSRASCSRCSCARPSSSRRAATPISAARRRRSRRRRRCSTCCRSCSSAPSFRHLSLAAALHSVVWYAGGAFNNAFFQRSHQMTGVAGRLLDFALQRGWRRRHVRRRLSRPTG